jgi:hypothetical protein
VPDGTEFSVVTTEELTSKTATEGDPLTFKVDEDVKVKGVVVIEKGAKVKAEIVAAEKNGYLGKSGKLAIRVESTFAVDEQPIRLRGSKGKEGEDKQVHSLALIILFGPLGILKHGKNAVIKEGTKIKVYTDEKKTIQCSIDQ